jgi:NADPH:quinone reductase-like Zn-dependent oxidoreductase
MTIPTEMTGVQLTGHGGPERNLWNQHIPTPQPERGMVLVKVLAAGVNNTDINTRVGWYAKEIADSTADVAPNAQVKAGGWSGALKFPRIQGSDLCGRVVAVGEGVADIKIAMRVTCPTNQPEPTPEAPTHFRSIGSEYDGAFAQFCLVPAKHLYDVSASPLTDVEIAAIPCAHGTALNLLTRANVGKGDRVLVTGASGGVGLAAVELAQHLGAEVTGVTSNEKKDAVLSAGAHAILDRNTHPENGAFTVAIDVVGGTGWAGVIDALAPGGRYAVSGAIAGPIVSADLRTIYLKDLTLFGCSFTPPTVFANLVRLVNAGQIKPLVSKTYPLAEINSAQADFSAKRFPGKLVLLPPET